MLDPTSGNWHHERRRLRVCGPHGDSPAVQALRLGAVMEPMDEIPTVEASEHPMVLAAMGRLATLGGWKRILAGKPLEDEADLHDAELLISAGVLRRTTDDGLEPVHIHPWYFDPGALAGGVSSLLRRALRHAEGGSTEWSGDDLEIIRAQGSGSISAAVAVAEGMLPLMPSSFDAFLDGSARFLDVGVGVGAISLHLCELFPGVRAVGLDVLAPALEIARHELIRAGMEERVELRLQSVADLRDRETFDLAWLPQPFIPRADLTAGLGAIFEALIPDRWLVAPIAAAPESADTVMTAIRSHGARLTGGGHITVEEMRTLLQDVGFVDVEALDQTSQIVMLARRPASV